MTYVMFIDFYDLQLELARQRKRTLRPREPLKRASRGWSAHTRCTPRTAEDVEDVEGHGFNGHNSDTDLLEVPTICKTYVREYPHKYGQKYSTDSTCIFGS